jgi:hypothetical protein
MTDQCSLMSRTEQPPWSYGEPVRDSDIDPRLTPGSSHGPVPASAENQGQSERSKDSSPLSQPPSLFPSSSRPANTISAPSDFELASMFQAGFIQSYQPHRPLTRAAAARLDEDPVSTSVKGKGSGKSSSSPSIVSSLMPDFNFPTYRKKEHGRGFATAIAQGSRFVKSS